MITLIAAMTDKNVIGRDNDLPWHLPADLRHFKETTKGYPIIMGRKTYESLPIRPLPHRTNIVLTQTLPEESTDSVFFVSKVIDAIECARLLSDQAFVIGGENIYRQTIDLADRLLITHIRGEYEGNKFFPEIDPKIWNKVNSISETEEFVIKEYRRD